LPAIADEILLQNQSLAGRLWTNPEAKTGAEEDSKTSILAQKSAIVPYTKWFRTLTDTLGLFIRMVRVPKAPDRRLTSPIRRPSFR
jgi:hypothetical protein